MMSIDSTELIYLLLGPGLIAVVAVLLRIDFRLKSRYDEIESRLIETEGRLAVMQRRAGEDSRERELEGEIELLKQQQEQLMLRDTETGPYYSAVRYAERGAGMEALIEQTGITRAEAELILKLHGANRDRRTAGAEIDSAD